MSLVNLTMQERDKFAAYLMQEIESDKLMMKQVKKLGPSGEMLIPKMKQNIVAAILIAKKLRDVEEITLSSAADVPID